jgi:hypothetical protein
MTFLDYFKKCYDDILADLGDDETCHALEDNALSYFCYNYSTAPEEDQRAAVEILKKIESLEFSRWYA